MSGHGWEKWPVFQRPVKDNLMNSAWLSLEPLSPSVLSVDSCKASLVTKSVISEDGCLESRLLHIVVLGTVQSLNIRYRYKVSSDHKKTSKWISVLNSENRVELDLEWIWCWSWTVSVSWSWSYSLSSCVDSNLSSWIFQELFQVGMHTWAYCWNISVNRMFGSTPTTPTPPSGISPPSPHGFVDLWICGFVDLRICGFVGPIFFIFF